ncbi:MAG: putative quinol monooxygenase [Desulfocapsaceae bacterium]|jgi:quinol monooxygenase YgiN|nr:putative quinol monooxygenase [Desulfocapsaceae bacterium]
MFVVTVDFLIKEQHVAEFMEAMIKQASHSLNREEGCLQFDVCRDPSDEKRVFLYEVYRDSEAFDRHLETEHFYSFNKTVSDWTASKTDQRLERLTC